MSLIRGFVRGDLGVDLLLLPGSLEHLLLFFLKLSLFLELALEILHFSLGLFATLSGCALVFNHFTKLILEHFLLIGHLVLQLDHLFLEVAFQVTDKLLLITQEASCN